MTKQENLLIKLSEECSEVGKAVSKALLYGLDDGYPGSDITNAQDIENELHDILAVVEMFYADQGLKFKVDSEKIRKKKDKIRMWMDYAKQCGKLER